jgi:iron complex outermembrane recepter protein
MTRFIVRMIISSVMVYCFSVLEVFSQTEVPEDLFSLSLDELMNIEVISVSRTLEKTFQAPAAVTVITHDDIHRSGYTSIGEILKMAPGLQVAQIDANKFAITSRGFNSRYANMLLVQIDGRTVYSTLHSGVYWETQELMLEDVDRIEIIRGPGASLWGANAVNGIINIITKSAKDTMGGYADGAYGNQIGFGDIRWGDKLGDNFFYRGYGKYIHREPMLTSQKEDAHDSMELPRGGYRCDWELSQKDLLTFQGDYYDGDVGQEYMGTGSESSHFNTDASGFNQLFRYGHIFSSTSDLSLQMYYDRTSRDDIKLKEHSDLFDVDFQHRFAWTPRNETIWGLGYRYIWQDTEKESLTEFVPSDPGLDSYSGFLQNKYAVMPDFMYLIFGSKVEDNYYTDTECQPSARILITPDPHHTIWASVSRAVRTPSIFEESVDISMPMGSENITILKGNSDQDPEELYAYEIGYRIKPIQSLIVDAACFYNDYDKLASSEIVDGTSTFGNNKKAYTYGGELSANWDITKIVRLTAWYAYIDGEMEDKTSGEKTDIALMPKNQAYIRPSISFPYNVTFDTEIYYVDEIQSARRKIPEYYRLDARLGWFPMKHLELSVAGQNLLVLQDGDFEDEHTEFSSYQPDSGYIERSVYVEVAYRW